MDERMLKEMLYKQFARIGKCLSSPKRIEILDLLSQGPKSVESIAKHTSITVANVSQHLQTLLHAKLVDYRKQGNYVIYELADPAVSKFLASLHGLSEQQLIEVQHIREEFIGQFSRIEEVTLPELIKRMETREVVLIDVRPKDEYEASHIPGAISMPLEELADQLATLPVNAEVIAYCRGPYCLMSLRAVEILKSHGIKAAHLGKSVQDWSMFMETRFVRSGVNLRED